MRSEALTKTYPIQWRNSATMLGGGLYVASVAIWHPLHEGLFGGTALAVTHPLGHALHHTPELPAYTLLAVGLVGLSRRLSPQLGRIGKIGLYLTLIGFALMAVGTLAIILFEGVLQTSISALETVHPLLLLPLIGALLCGPAILKAKVLTPDGAWLIIIGAALFLGMIFTGLIDTTWGYWVGKGFLTVFSAGWTWLGYAFWLEATAQPGGYNLDTTGGL
ncbi:MAG TPA: hypothetical protein P5526_13120 [Anaerolineae bacterium]|nr:hypothetical protein [Anaerolineae bacterium]